MIMSACYPRTFCPLLNARKLGLCSTMERATFLFCWRNDGGLRQFTSCGTCKRQCEIMGVALSQQVTELALDSSSLSRRTLNLLDPQGSAWCG
jgi:hypothetical protein